MLHILQSAKSPSESNKILRAMFAARKSVFVDLLKWNVPVIDDLYEVDEFDTEDAIYLVLCDEDGNHLGSTRLLPTIKPHILDSLYPELCAEAPPRGPTIFEITRFCLDRRSFASQRRKIRDTLVSALADYALGNGITAYSAIADQQWAMQISNFGWRYELLGSPRACAGRMLVAFHILVTYDILDLLNGADIRPDPELIADPPKQPGILRKELPLIDANTLQTRQSLQHR